MADWDVLQNTASGRDFMSIYGSDLSTSYRLMMEVPSSISSIHTSLSSETCDENTFCTADNIDQCIIYLNQELSVLGFKSLSYDSHNKLTSLINCLYEILRLYQRNARLKEELENRVHRTTSELNHYQSANTRLKTEREKVLCDIAKEQEKYRQVVTKQKSLSSKLKAEKDELKRLQCVIKDRDIQFKHEMKKREREANKLKERLHQLLIDKTPNRRVGLDIANSLQRADGKRSTWKGTNNNKQEEMYQVIVSNYEEKQRELMLENTDLRDCLVHMQKELISVMSQPHASRALPVTSNSINSSNSIMSDDDDDSSSSQLTLDELSDGYFQLPYDIMKDNIQKSFREACKKIKENINWGRQPSPSSSGLKTSPSKVLALNMKSQTDEELEKLKKQMKKYKEIIKQQEDLIQQSIQCQSKSVENSFLHESQLLEEKENLAEQRKLFYHEKSNFEEERRQFTEAAIRLGRERKAFEEERADVIKNQFLHLSPFGSNSPFKLETPHKSERARLLPSTPVFSPAPSGKPRTPSTQELYRILGLTPKDLGRKDKSTPVTKDFIDKNVKKVASSESLLSGSCFSEPCTNTGNGLPIGSRSSSGSRSNTGSRTILDNYVEARRTLFRRSSTGSNEGLNV